jgi:hypothetical protein
MWTKHGTCCIVPAFLLSIKIFFVEATQAGTNASIEQPMELLKTLKNYYS